MTDGEALLNLLKQTRRRINKISGNSAYYTRQFYETVRIKRAILPIPPRKETTCWERDHPRNLVISYQQSYDSCQHKKTKYGLLFPIKNGKLLNQNTTERDIQTKGLRCSNQRGLHNDKSVR